MRCASPENSKNFFDCSVVAIENPVGEIYQMKLNCPAIAYSAAPGQFVNIKVNSEFIPLLRKPFSISRSNRDEGWFEILWKIVGKGTQIMSEYKLGDVVDLLGPLGKGFLLPENISQAFLVAGGLGVAPLPLLCEQLISKEVDVELFLGAKTINEVALRDVFDDYGVKVHLATEDGSEGTPGLVTELLEQRLKEFDKYSHCHLFSCGPIGFLNAMIDITKRYEIAGQISIETMMGCGFGICVGCPVQTAESSGSEPRYKLACLDGPVFNAREVILHD